MAKLACSGGLWWTRVDPAILLESGGPEVSHYRRHVVGGYGMLWWFVLVIPALLLSRGNLGVGILIYGISVAVLYLVSLGRHSNRRCRSCGGTGRHRGAMFIWGDRLCTRCG